MFFLGVCRMFFGSLPKQIIRQFGQIFCRSQIEGLFHTKQTNSASSLPGTPDFEIKILSLKFWKVSSECLYGKLEKPIILIMNCRVKLWPIAIAIVWEPVGVLNAGRIFVGFRNNDDNNKTGDIN